ncbi:hypothetical protein RJ55_01267 [Drechmeria coniospora]|nr:hypothetical protein RJ55_01267 [Drechmeria coniospora]
MGLSYSQIAQKEGVSRGSIAGIIFRYDDRKSAQSLKRSGRPRIISERDKRAIFRFCRESRVGKVKSRHGYSAERAKEYSQRTYSLEASQQDIHKCSGEHFHSIIDHLSYRFLEIRIPHAMALIATLYSTALKRTSQELHGRIL